MSNNNSSSNNSSSSSRSSNIFYSSAVLNQDAVPRKNVAAAAAAANSGGGGGGGIFYNDGWGGYKQKNTRALFRQEQLLPFRQLLHPRQHSFTLQVPIPFCFNEKTHTPNYLYFSKLDVIPDFYNEASEAFRLDTIQEDNTVIEFPLTVSVEYGPNQYFQQDPARKVATYAWPKLSDPPADFIENVLKFLASAIQLRPAPHNRFNPVFFDWTFYENTDNFLSHDQLIYETVPNNFSLFYHEHKNKATFVNDYAFEWNPAVHDNPAHWKTDLFAKTCLELPGINPWKYPRAMAVNSDQLRLRLHLQPYTVFTCSNFALLQVLGFDWEDPLIQSHINRKNNQYNVFNDKAHWLTWTATNHPHPYLQRPAKAHTSISVKPLPSDPQHFLSSSSSRSSRQPVKIKWSKHFRLTKAQIANDAIFFETIVTKGLSDVILTFNLNLTCDVTSGKLTIPKPDSDKRLLSCTVRTSDLIVRRLGYRPVSPVLDHTSEHFTDRLAQKQLLLLDDHSVYAAAGGGGSGADATMTDDTEDFFDTTSQTATASASAAAAARKAAVAAQAEELRQLHRKAREKSEILVYDTGAIHVTSNQGFSEGYNNFGGQFVASLKPKMPGIMTLDKSTQYLRISECQAGTHFIPLTFQLNTFIQEDESVLLNWPTGATIHGILQSFSS